MNNLKVLISKGFLICFVIIFFGCTENESKKADNKPQAKTDERQTAVAPQTPQTSPENVDPATLQTLTKAEDEKRDEEIKRQAAIEQDDSYDTYSGTLCVDETEAVLISPQGEAKIYTVCLDDDGEFYYFKDRRGPFWLAEGLEPVAFSAQTEAPIGNISMYQSSYRTIQPLYVRQTSSLNGPYAGSPYIQYYGRNNFSNDDIAASTYFDMLLSDYERGYITQKEAYLRMTSPRAFSICKYNAGLSKILHGLTYGISGKINGAIYKILNTINEGQPCYGAGALAGGYTGAYLGGTHPSAAYNTNGAYMPGMYPTRGTY